MFDLTLACQVVTVASLTFLYRHAGPDKLAQPVTVRVQMRQVWGGRRGRRIWRSVMDDLLYLAITVVAFGLLWAFVQACAALGRAE